MNNDILHSEVQQFINDNITSDLTSLILKGSPFPALTIQEIAAQIQSKQKCKDKLPTWFSTKNIYFPNKINIEQTSSEKTAEYKSSLIQGKTIVDLTGGFGVDTYSFSKKFNTVFHCETNSDLHKITKHNFAQLEVTNVDFHNTNGIEFVLNSINRFDWLYIDPSRRDSNKEKVFLLEDYQPNVPESLKALLEKSQQILLKISPMMDISATIDALFGVKKIHVIAVNNEVKELLVEIEKDFHSDIHIETVNLTKKRQEVQKFIFNFKSEPKYSDPLSYVYEPNAAIMKSGAYDQLSERFQLFKIQKHSHLFTSDTLIDFPGRRFRIEHVTPFDKKKILKLLDNKKANITTRNFPLSVVQIRKKTGIRDGGNTFLFCTTNQSEKPVVLVCKKV